MDDIEDVIARDTPMPPWPSIPSGATSAYSNITANDNSRIHNGNNIYIHQYYTLQSRGNGFEDNTPQITLKRKRSLADIEVNPRTRKTQESLYDVLKKLTKLSLSVRHRKEGDSAEKIARRVAAVFEAITAHGDEASWDKPAARQLGKLGANVKLEERFDINSVPQRRALGKIAKAKRRRIIVQLGHWNISLTTTTTDFAHEGGLREMEIFSALRVEPHHRYPGSALGVFFSEHRNDSSTNTIPPTVLAYKPVRDDSEVIRLIQTDDLPGLLRLLACGGASIHDCDESGRSLLHHACYTGSRECCAFLIGCGVDIDRLEMSFDDGKNTRNYETPSQTSSTWFMRTGAHTCFDMLWHAGADPTITADSSEMPPLLEFLRLGWAGQDSPTRAYFEEISPYLDFQERFEHKEGRGYWLELCLSQRIFYDPSILQAFVDKGADVTEVDNYGFNCLFVFMSRVNGRCSDLEYKVLRRLLEVFNDVHALDATGNDIFAYINELQVWPKGYGPPFEHCGSYRQDLWYFALKQSKLDVRHNIAPCSRLARYTRSYTPKHYLALCHLDEEPSKRQIQTLLQEHPLSEDEERIQREMDSLWDLESESDSDSEEHTQRETEARRIWESESDFSHEKDDGSM